LEQLLRHGGDRVGGGGQIGVTCKHTGKHEPQLNGSQSTDMASNLDFVDYVMEQLGNAKHITYKKMFGEYAIYCDGKVVALICDNQLFVKITEAGKEFDSSLTQAPPYPGAKPHFLIEDKLEDKNWLSQLITITCYDLPEPKVKKSGRH
jgi:TfoX/Sxy family transcriptional regulator of competence genes